MTARTKTEILEGVLGRAQQEKTSSTVTIADRRQLDFWREDTRAQATELQIRQERDRIQLAMAYHKTRTGVAGITGAAISVPVGVVSGTIAAILDGAADGISLVAPVVVPPLMTFVITLFWLTVNLVGPFNWSVAGQMVVVATWRAAIALVFVLTLIGGWQWFKTRMDRDITADYQASYDGLVRGNEK